MEYKHLGKSDLQISKVSFGCMSLGTDNVINKSLLLEAVDKGINFFDTADLYGQGANELTVGNAFKAMRNKVIIATKVGNQIRPDGSGWDWNPTKKYILEAVEKSLTRLQTDYIDLYQLHGGTLEDAMDDTIEAFEHLKQQGKIRYYGISSIRPNVIREYIKHSNIVSVMLQYSLLDRRPEESILELLQQHNIGVLARGSLAQGLLTGKEPKSYLNHSEEKVKQAAQNIKTVSNSERNEVAVAIKYILNHVAITSAVLGIRNENQLADALKAVNSNQLTDFEIYQLTENITAFNYEQHR